MLSDSLQSFGRRLSAGPGVDSLPVWKQGGLQESQASALNRNLAALLVITTVLLLGVGIGLDLARLIIPPLYLLAVLAIGLRAGRQPATLAALVGAAAFCVLFLLPGPNLGPHDAGAFISFSALLLAGLAVGRLSGKAAEATNAARIREAHLSALQALAAAQAGASGLEEILRTFAHHFQRTIQLPLIVAVPKGKMLTPRFCSPGFLFDGVEAAAAGWAFKHQEPAGRGTVNLSSARAYYLPLQTWRGAVGVLGVVADGGGEALSAEGRDLLDAFAYQATLSIARGLSDEDAQQVELLREADRIQKALLNSVSHNLRTPLASIIGTLSSLLDDRSILDQATQSELLDNALEEARRLNRLVRNLLDGARLESGEFRIKLDICEFQDVIAATLAQLGEATARRRIVVRMDDELPMLRLDLVLVSQVLVNLVENALKYSPPELPVEIHVRRSNGHLHVRVVDYGKGIPEDDIDHIFERFHRGRLSGCTGGLGLGLSICKGFVEAHNGRIWVERLVERGTAVAFVLPCPEWAQARENGDESGSITHTRG